MILNVPLVQFGLERIGKMTGCGPLISHKSVSFEHADKPCPSVVLHSVVAESRGSATVY